MLFYSSIEDLKIILRNGVLKTNRYDVVLSLPPTLLNKWGNKYTKFLPLICNIPIPSLALENVERKIYAESSKMVTGVKFEELEFDTYIDGKGEVIEFWNDWIMSTVNFENRTAKWYEDYVCPSMTVFLHKKVQGVKFFNIYPTSIGQITLGYDTDNQVSILKVRMCFEYMRDLKSSNASSSMTSNTGNSSLSDVFEDLTENITKPITDDIYTKTQREISNIFSKAYDYLRIK